MSDAVEEFDDLDEDDEELSVAGGGKGKLFAIAAICLAAGGGGGWYFSAEAAPPAEPAADAATDPTADAAEGEPTEEDKTGGPIIELETFIVNLNTRAAEEMRYLKCSVAVELSGDEWSAPFEAQKVKVRHAIIMFLSSLTLADTQGAENKQALQQALRQRVASVVGEPAVSHAYLTEFVIQ